MGSEWRKGTAHKPKTFCLVCQRKGKDWSSRLVQMSSFLLYIFLLFISRYLSLLNLLDWNFFSPLNHYLFLLYAYYTNYPCFMVTFYHTKQLINISILKTYTPNIIKKLFVFGKIHEYLIQTCIHKDLDSVCLRSCVCVFLKRRCNNV